MNPPHTVKHSGIENNPMNFPTNVNLTFKWITGILVTCVMALTALWAENLTKEVKSISTSVTIQGQAVANIEGQLISNGVRLKRIEENQDKVMLALPRK